MSASATSSFAGQANAFVYHRFNDPRYPSTNISGADFRAHLETLRARDFTVLRLGEVVERLIKGTGLPERCAVITVDDAYRSFFTDGWPLLREYGYPATLFVSTDSVGAGDFLTWEELRRLREEGVELGNHSAAHRYLLDGHEDPAWAETVRDDLARSLAAFRQNLAMVPALFAYPYGEYSRALAELVRASGFVAAFGQQSGVIAAGQDLFALPRFPVGGSYAALDGFRSKLFMKTLPVTSVSPEDTIILEDNPPELMFYLNSDDVAEATLRCFVSTQAECRVDRREGGRGWYRVVASAPLSGRRNKYTVTASDARGRTWFWYSQLWILPEHGPVADDPVAR